MKIDLPEDYFSTDHDTYLFISGFSGMNIPNEHVIHGIRFQDIKHLHDTEDQDSDKEQRAFTGKSQDIIRKGSLFHNHAFTFESYNQEQIKHNALYSKLVAAFISNSEQMITHLDQLPSEEIVANLS